MKKKTLFIYLLLLISLCSMPVCSASEDEIGKVHMHESPDGTLSFFAQRENKPFSLQIYSVLELHKVIASDKTYYAIRACVGKYKAYETPIQSVTLKLDGVNYPLTPLEGARKEEFPNAVQGWYSVPDELLAKLNNTTEWSMKITYTNGKSRDVDQDDNFIKAVKRLKTITKGNYTQQEGIIQEKNNYSAFIPNAKPEDIAQSIIYNVNYDTSNNKTQLQSYYYTVSLSNDNKYLAFYNVNSRSDDVYFCGWVTLIPQPSGTWVTLDTLNYSSRHVFWRIKTNNKASIMNLYRADDIVNAISTTYNNLYGSYDYGFTWQPIIGEKDSKNTTRANWNPGPFKVSNVNSKLFPELENIKVGDIVTEINGISTQTMNYEDSLSKVLYRGEKTTFLIKDAQGNQKTISIDPKFVASSHPSKNFSQIFANDKNQFSKFDINRDFPFDYPMSFNPLGEGPQLGSGYTYLD